jgi:hypothetical protein
MKEEEEEGKEFYTSFGTEISFNFFGKNVQEYNC